MPQIPQKIEEKGVFPNPFCEASITLLPKPVKDIARKESQRPISMMNTDAKLHSKILENWIYQPLKGTFPVQLGFIPGMHR